MGVGRIDHTWTPDFSASPRDLEPKLLDLGNSTPTMDSGPSAASGKLSVGIFFPDIMVSGVPPAPLVLFRGNCVGSVFRQAGDSVLVGVALLLPFSSPLGVACLLLFKACLEVFPCCLSTPSETLAISKQVGRE